MFDQAAQQVLGDRQVWREEQARPAAAALPWPLDLGGKGYVQLMRFLAASTVESVLDAIREAEGPDAVPPVHDPAFQVVLRVCKRACDAAEAALRARFGGTGRMSLKRDLVNWQKLLDAERAVRSGVPRDEAFRAAGLSRAGAYRALKRKRRPAR